MNKLRHLKYDHPVDPDANSLSAKKQARTLGGKIGKKPDTPLSKQIPEEHDRFEFLRLSKIICQN